jgi:hypothetical protein
MARRDTQSNEYEWGGNFSMGGHSFLFDSPSPLEALEQLESSRRAQPEALPKKVTRKVKGSSAGPSGI